MLAKIRVEINERETKDKGDQNTHIWFIEKTKEVGNTLVLNKV